MKSRFINQTETLDVLNRKYGPGWVVSPPPNPSFEKHLEDTAIRETVAALGSYGLTEEYLRANISREVVGRFSRVEGLVLIYLVTGNDLSHIDTLPPLPQVQRITPAQAIKEINDLAANQIYALKTLWGYGLRGEHLRSFRPADENDFYYSHRWALEYLIRDREPHLTPTDAIQRINGLTPSQAEDLIPKVEFKTSRYIA